VIDMVEPIWIRRDVVLAIHLRQISEHGGEPGVRDEGLLDSALARPKNLYAYAEDSTDLPALAASYTFGIVKNHPFLDGNKRVGYVVGRAFLRLNGADVEATQSEKVSIIWQLAAGEITEVELTEWVRKHLTESAS